LQDQESRGLIHRPLAGADVNHRGREHRDDAHAQTRPTFITNGLLTPSLSSVPKKLGQKPVMTVAIRTSVSATKNRWVRR